MTRRAWAYSTRKLCNPRRAALRCRESAMIKTFCVALLLCLPLSAQAALAIQHWHTPHGAQVIFVESHELPILDVSVDFPAGSARDPDGQAGLAQLTHILLDQGAGGLSEAAGAGAGPGGGPGGAARAAASGEA